MSTPAELTDGITHEMTIQVTDRVWQIGVRDGIAELMAQMHDGVKVNVSRSGDLVTLILIGPVGPVLDAIQTAQTLGRGARVMDIFLEATSPRDTLPSSNHLARLLGQYKEAP